ncbi:MAG TPA: FxsC protein [Actinocrinis sp.]|nr:FxsC protein [Actinocrinis sp.]
MAGAFDPRGSLRRACTAQAGRGQADPGPPDPDGFSFLYLSFGGADRERPAEQRDDGFWVRKFRGHLSAEIARLLDLPSGQKQPAAGAERPQDAMTKLATCTVFMPLYTRRYFSNPDRGSEWSVIRKRQELQDSVTGTHPNAVVPVLWEPMRPQDVPVWPEAAQYAHDELGRAYHAYGLAELLRVRDHEPDYRQAVRFLARQVVAVATAPERLLPLPETADLGRLPNEFPAHTGSDTGPDRVRVVVAALNDRSAAPLNRSTRWYGESALDWSPYRAAEGAGSTQRTPVALQAASIARRRNHVAEVTELSRASEELADTDPGGPTIVLVDPWATLDPGHRAVLDELDRVCRAKPWIRIIVPWNTRDPETAANAPLLHGGIDARLGRARAQGRIPPRRARPGPGDGTGLDLAVGEELRAALAQYLRQSAKYLPAGPYPAKPRLKGPVGMGALFGRDDHDEPPEPGERSG